MPYAVQDATATVLEIHFANNEDQVLQRRRTGAVLESLLTGSAVSMEARLDARLDSTKAVLQSLLTVLGSLKARLALAPDNRLSSSRSSASTRSSATSRRTRPSS